MRVVFSIIPIALIIAGCSGGGTTRNESSAGSTVDSDELAAYEAEFRPSEYDADLDEYFRKSITDSVATTPVDSQIVEQEPEPEFIQGFRVQLFSSTDFEEANMKKAEAEALFPEEKFYVVYDAPVYKIRGGNFRTRFEADKLSKRLGEHGYRNAWIVPDKIEKLSPRLTGGQK